jgi:hypothetical protein
MMVARWSIDAKFGYKQVVVESMKRWLKDIGPQAGIKQDRTRLLTGSVGALEATIQTEHEIENLAELEGVWARLATNAAHSAWSKELEPNVVSGTSRWEIYRLL